MCQYPWALHRGQPRYGRAHAQSLWHVVIPCFPAFCLLRRRDEGVHLPGRLPQTEKSPPVGSVCTCALARGRCRCRCLPWAARSRSAPPWKPWRAPRRPMCRERCPRLRPLVDGSASPGNDCRDGEFLPVSACGCLPRHVRGRGERLFLSSVFLPEPFQAHCRALHGHFLFLVLHALPAANLIGGAAASRADVVFQLAQRNTWTLYFLAHFSSHRSFKGGAASAPCHPGSLAQFPFSRSGAGSWPVS
ncbi:MAG: hypothetical protein GAK35_02971 [Herbaspirillum frisingense]|uniref:Uncharacterized protein n=1 Tax=Herbaspirillum frisingense TaxID=92645 RepID=A0A7V8FV65_9BURK|nr:MAG: hypothetical protein GAK35_02971 [Herbaspirillum frisingense]